MSQNLKSESITEIGISAFLPSCGTSMFVPPSCPCGVGDESLSHPPLQADSLLYQTSLLFLADKADFWHVVVFIEGD